MSQQNLHQTLKTNQSTLTEEQLNVIAKVSVKLSELRFEATFIPPVSVGPVVSIYRFLPTGQTRVSNLEGLATDFAVLLGVEDVFVKRLPGESAVGVFVPNKERQLVTFLKCIGDLWKVQDKFKVPLLFGVNHLGAPTIVELTTLPHLLIAGSTGAGKSTLLGSIISGLIYCKTADQVQFVLSDTKNVEFGHFIGAPHLLFEPATSVYQTLERLDWVIDSMDDRLKTLGKYGYRNIHEYLANPNMQRMPFLVIIIDELADLMMYKGEKRGESKISQDKISTIVQKSRAAGIYFIASTQRPSVNVIAGSIKANFPARLTFRLPSEADSRTVISTSGAEHLLSQGDMLFVDPNKPGLQRLHAPFARLEDLKACVEAATRR